MKKYNNDYSDEESVYNETDDMFEGEDISNEEVPDFVQKFSEKQDKEEFDYAMNVLSQDDILKIEY